MGAVYRDGSWTNVNDKTPVDMTSKPIIHSLVDAFLRHFSSKQAVLPRPHLLEMVAGPPSSSQVQSSRGTGPRKASATGSAPAASKSSQMRLSVRQSVITAKVSGNYFVQSQRRKALRIK